MEGVLCVHKKLWIALGVVVLLLAGFCGVVTLQPAAYRVARSATIAAPPAAVFAQVNDFHNWDAWSPWAKMDPHAKATFDGPASGAGAGFAWDGNSDVGAGHMTITQSHPSDRIRIKLEFVRPFAGTNDTLFTFEPAAGGTQITWAMSGEKNWFAKAMCMYMSMDTMVGGDFEKGLATMKSIVESSNKK